MNLYLRDYSSLTDEETKQWEAIKESEYNSSLFGKINKFREYPKAARHYLSLFPNNYLDIEELRDEEHLRLVAQEFLNKLDEFDINEQHLLNFINRNRYYVIIASIFKLYNFGHHDAYLFKEFPLGTSYKADYLLVGKGSGGYEFVFIELEKPTERIFLKSGDLGETFNKGLRQIASWKRWCENYFVSLSETFNKYKNINKHLPSEFTSNDSMRRHYVVVAGRRSDFDINKEITYSIRREKKRTEAIELLHYDNLYDFTLSIIGNDSF